MRPLVEPRPGDRLKFTRREVLLTTPEERRALSPAEEHLLDMQRFDLKQSVRQARMSYDACVTKGMEQVAAGVPDPELDTSRDVPAASVRRRHPAAALG